jgi:hypothetical protein
MTYHGYILYKVANNISTCLVHSFDLRIKRYILYNVANRQTIHDDIQPLSIFCHEVFIFFKIFSSRLFLSYIKISHSCTLSLLKLFIHSHYFSNNRVRDICTGYYFIILIPIYNLYTIVTTLK